MNWVILAAGGSGERLGREKNKIFLPLKGLPIIFYSLAGLENSEIVDKVLITARKKDFRKIKQIVKRGKFKKVEAVISASFSRQKSTWKVLKKLKKEGIKSDDLVGVHNAVNPFATEEELQAVFKAAKRHGAALLAVSARDTVKIVGKKGFVEKTPERRRVWNAQTPQVARFDWLFAAFKKAEEEGFEGTDDAMLLERTGRKVKIVPCSEENFKITYPSDLPLAESILEKRLRKEKF